MESVSFAKKNNLEELESNTQYALKSFPNPFIRMGAATGCPESISLGEFGMQLAAVPTSAASQASAAEVEGEGPCFRPCCPRQVLPVAQRHSQDAPNGPMPDERARTPQPQRMAAAAAQELARLLMAAAQVEELEPVTQVEELEPVTQVEELEVAARPSASSGPYYAAAQPFAEASRLASRHCLR